MTFSFKVFITRLEHWFHLCEALMIVDLDLSCHHYLQYDCDSKTWSSNAATAYYRFRVCCSNPPNMKNKNLSILTFITLFGPRSNI